jgi:hypothetical protein
LQFGDQRVVERDAGGLLGRTLPGRREERLQRCFVQFRVRRLSKVANDDVDSDRIGRCGTQPLDDGAGEARGVRAVGTGAGIDLEGCSSMTSEGVLMKSNVVVSKSFRKTVRWITSFQWRHKGRR